MLRIKFNNIKASSIIEYAVLIMIVLGALFVFKGYIQRGIFGHWKAAGDSFGLGRQYDAQRTVDCSFDQDTNSWYDQGCFDQRRAGCSFGNDVCDSGAISSCLTMSCNAAI